MLTYSSQLNAATNIMVYGVRVPLRLKRKARNRSPVSVYPSEMMTEMLMGHLSLVMLGSLRNQVSSKTLNGSQRLIFGAAQGYPRDVQALGNQIECQELQELICRFLHSVSHSENADIVLPLEECPQFSGLIQVYHSAVAVYSDSKNPFYAGHFCTKH